MKTKSKFGYITIALVFLANPNINIIDILPDFVGFFILAWLLGKADRIIPYFSEARSALIKLGIVSALRIPATLIMFANLSTGRDILPMFTLAFAVVETIFLVSAIQNGFEGLFYLGQRASSSALIAPFPTGQKGGKTTTFSTSNLCLLTKIFLIAKVAVAVLPELCMLTFSSDITQKIARTIYPIAIIVGIALVLVLGIAWATLCRKYKNAVRADMDLTAELKAIAGEEKLAEIDKELGLKKAIKGTYFLFIAVLLTPKISFEGVMDGINLLPHFLTYTALIICALRLFDSYGRAPRIAICALGVVSIVLNLVQQYFYVSFIDEYNFMDLVDYAPAKAAYAPVASLALAESLTVLLLCLITGYYFRRFVLKSTGIDPKSESYSKLDRQYHNKTTLKGWIAMGGIALTSLLEGLNCVLESNPQLVFTDISDVTKPVIAASPAPWLPTLTLFISIALILFTYSFTSELREDVKLKNQ